MADIARGLGAQRIEAIATSAVREAKQQAVFLKRVEEEVGLKVRVISAEEEARLACLSFLHHFELGIEIWGAQQKAGLFEEVFQTKLVYKHVNPKE